MDYPLGQSILITGGTGSFGKEFVSYILNNHPEVERLVIFSRDELKQWEMQQLYPMSKFPQLRYFLGDVRDLDRLKMAFDRIDTIVHAAALKQVPAAEYNPMEFIRTNVLGADNIVKACLDTGVQRVVALSTDKAAAPVNLYGATKLCSDKLFVVANNIKGDRNLRFSVVRYGNVMGSRGSVIPYFMDKASTGELPITDPKMTRFNITLEEGVQMVVWAIANAIGGEVFVPKIPSYRILDVAEAIGPGCIKPVVGIRPGEKIHEEMITTADSFSTFDLGRYYAILSAGSAAMPNYNRMQDAVSVEPGFTYNSGSNDHFLTVDQIRHLIRLNIDSQFMPI